MSFRLRDGVSMAETDYGAALLDEDSGRYWNLNVTGGVALRTLLAGGSVEEAARALTEAFDVGDETADRDVRNLLEELRSANLLRPVPTAPTPAADAVSEGEGLR